MSPSNAFVQGLWVGGELSAMEQICIRSFLANGHGVHLYTYGNVAGIPDGTVVLDGNAILPADQIFQYRNGSFAGFSNFFRYRLLLDKGGWWVDLDTVCLRPFDFETPYVFSSEMADGEQLIDSAAIKSPPGSGFAANCWSQCATHDDPKALVWGETGPRLVGRAVREAGLQDYVQPAATFCPLSYRDWRRVLDPNDILTFSGSTYAIHLWNELWRRNGIDKSAAHPEACFYEVLRRRYLVR
jgi:hypothetical protein